jgi:hypothetical protein
MALKAVPPTALTPLEVKVPFTVLELSMLVPTKCSTECFDIGVVDITKLYVVISYEVDRIEVLIMVTLTMMACTRTANHPGRRRSWMLRTNLFTLLVLRR